MPELEQSRETPQERRRRWNSFEPGAAMDAGTISAGRWVGGISFAAFAIFITLIASVLPYYLGKECEASAGAWLVLDSSLYSAKMFFSAGVRRIPRRRYFKNWKLYGYD